MNQNEIKDMVTQLIIDELAKGNVPWRKGWTTAGFMPTSLQTGKEYQGINALMLAIIGDLRGYSRPLWVTYNQARRMGGNVIKGQTGTKVVFMSKITKESKEEGVADRSFFMYKLDTVFNIEQTEGVELPAKYEEKAAVDVMPNISSVWDGYQNRPELFYKAQGRAFYSPDSDSITLPALEQFESASEHAYTFAHEMIHSTGHQSRADRWSSEDKASAFGCENYAKEELIAELGACMLLSSAGIEFDVQNSGAYIKNWLTALQNDTSLIFKAAAKAQAAVTHILGVKVEEEVPA